MGAPAADAHAPLAFGPYRLDAAGDLRDASGLVPLTPKAAALLRHLASQAGRLVTTHELLDAVWPDVFVGDGVLKVCIREIRRTLGDDARQPRFIETAHRRGYRFIAPVTEAAPRPDAPAPAAATVAATVPAAAVPAAPAPAGPAGAVVSPADIPVRYARSGDVNIAYQVLGSGPVDLVFVMGWVSHLEYAWREPGFARFLARLAGCARLILFDKRGTGLSDPVAQLPTLEQRMDDVRAVMDAAGSERAVLLGVSEGGPMCVLFAATWPERTEALVMIGTYARRTRAADYPWAPTEAQREAFCQEMLARWGGPVGIETRAPSRAHDPVFRDWWASYLRMGASPATAVALTRMNARIDVRHVLPTVRVPALVLHRTGDRCLHVEEGRFVAQAMPDARFVELPGSDHLPFVGDAEAMLEEIERFVRQPRTRSAARRMLATILSIVPAASEPAASEASHRETEDALRMILDEALTPSGGVGSGGDGGGGRGSVGGSAGSGGGGGITSQRAGADHLLLFDGPARAIRCGAAIAAAADRRGLRIQVGVHAGECDMLAGEARGLAVEISRRIAHRARPGELLVSRTVVDLVAGAGLRFTDRGGYRLTDMPYEWHVFAAEREHQASPPAEASGLDTCPDARPDRCPAAEDVLAAGVGRR